VTECQAEVPFDPPPDAVDTYEQLLARDDVDAVYLPLPTGIRVDWAVRAAEAGKHVLSEKPVGAHASDVQKILDACRRNNVQFMDGVMFMHSRRLQQIRTVLDDDRNIGQIKRITSQFSCSVPEEFFQDNIRVNSRLEPLGCLGDLGWYNLRFILWVMNEQLPREVSARMLAQHAGPGSSEPVPTEFSAELFYSHASASLYCSFLTGHQQWASISGTNGSVHLRDFVLPYYGSEVSFELSRPVFSVRGCDFNMEEHTRRTAVAEYSNSAPGAQETNLFQNFARLALSGSPDARWGEIALKTQRLLDACLESSRDAGRLVKVAE
jgi:predicted dehydrogenase